MTVKHRQLAPTVRHDSDDLLANSMASLNLDNILEKGTTLSFGDWIFVADGSGGFTTHLSGEQNIETPRLRMVRNKTTRQHKLTQRKTSLKILRKVKISI